MSERRGRHQRRPSQSVVLSFSAEELSAPPVDNGEDKKAASPSAVATQQHIRSPLPPGIPAPLPASQVENEIKDDKKVTDVVD